MRLTTTSLYVVQPSADNLYKVPALEGYVLVLLYLYLSPVYWYWYLFVECLTWPAQRSGSEPGPQVERQTNADFSTTFRFGRPSVCLCGVSKTGLIAAVSPPVVPFCKLKAKTSDPKTLRPTPSTAYYDSATYLAKQC